MKFQSSMREVMLFIKYSKDKENLSRALAANERRFREVERRAADVIEAITNSGIKYDEEDEVVNVCQAIQEIRMEERHRRQFPNDAIGIWVLIGKSIEEWLKIKGLLSVEEVTGVVGGLSFLRFFVRFICKIM